MKERDEWIPMIEVDWLDPENNMFSVDTRDFHVGHTTKSYDKEFNPTLAQLLISMPDLVGLLNRWFAESGGEREWRYFTVPGITNWSLKYLRIYRIGVYFLVCDSDSNPLSAEILSATATNDLGMDDSKDIPVVTSGYLHTEPVEIKNYYEMSNGTYRHLQAIRQLPPEMISLTLSSPAYRIENETQDSYRNRTALRKLLVKYRGQY